MALDEIVSAGTSVHLFNELTKEEREDSLCESGDFDVGSLKNCELHHHYGNPVSRRELEELHDQLNLLKVHRIVYVCQCMYRPMTLTDQRLFV